MPQNPTTESPNFKDILSGMQNSYRELFVNQNCRKEIENVIKALGENKPLLEMEEIKSAGFSTIFLPFHRNTIISENNEEISLIDFLEKNNYPAEMIAFCRLSGEIESMTDTLHLESEEPSNEFKLKLKGKLKEFLGCLGGVKGFG